MAAAQRDQEGKGGSVNEDDLRQQQEREQFLCELEIVQRIERGTSTQDDARYVARAFGLDTGSKHAKVGLNS
jgi:hypothetical protein